MKKVVLLFTMALIGCSRGSGKYVGQAVDVGWEGYFVQTCEAMFKTSEQASVAQSASSYSKSDCDLLQENIGKKVEVTWRHCFPCFFLDKPYEIVGLKFIE